MIVTSCCERLTRCHRSRCWRTSHPSLRSNHPDGAPGITILFAVLFLPAGAWVFPPQRPHVPFRPVALRPFSSKDRPADYPNPLSLVAYHVTRPRLLGRTRGQSARVSRHADTALSLASFRFSETDRPT
jgi:hypothetical protein